MLALECHVTTALDTPEHIREVVQAVDSPWVRANFDPVNLLGDFGKVWHNAEAMRHMWQTPRRVLREVGPHQRRRRRSGVCGAHLRSAARPRACSTSTRSSRSSATSARTPPSSSSTCQPIRPLPRSPTSNARRRARLHLRSLNASESQSGPPVRADHFLRIISACAWQIELSAYV